MDWSASTVWWLLTGALVAVELATGSFYLLMLAVGTTAGALAAHLGLGPSVQWITAALVGAGCTATWHLQRARSPRSALSAANKDANMDIGETVQVPAWNTDGSARVSYRGASWTVRYVGNAAPAPGPHVIVSVQSGWLGVAPTP